MDHSAINFRVNCNGGRITGFSLTANETHAGCFCYSFPAAMGARKADIQFRDGHIVFIHKGITPDMDRKDASIFEFSEGGVFEADISPEDAKQIEDLLHSEGAYRNCRPTVTMELVWGKGFTLTAKKP